MTPTEIKALRLSLGLSQRRLAKALGCSYRVVESWEYGTREPSATAVFLLQHATECAKLRRYLATFQRQKKPRKKRKRGSRRYYPIPWN